MPIASEAVGQAEAAPIPKHHRLLHVHVTVPMHSLEQSQACCRYSFFWIKLLGLQS